MPKYSTGLAKRKKNSKELEPLTDIRQAGFYKAYFDPQSEYFGNAYQSAIRAGYTHEYAKTITAQMPIWLSERISTESMVSKAERNIGKMLDYIENTDTKTRVKADISKFVLERRKREEWGKDEQPKTQNNLFIVMDDKQRQAIAERVLRGIKPKA